MGHRVTCQQMARLGSFISRHRARSRNLPGPANLPVRFTAVFLIFGIVLILISDQVFFAVTDVPETLRLEASIRAWTITLISALLFYLLMRYSLKHLNRAHRATELSELRYRSLIETMPDGILETDLDGQVTFANPVMQRILHALEDETAKEQLIQRIHACARNTRPSAHGPWAAAAVTITVRTTDATRLDLQVRCMHRTNEDGESDGYASVVTDVTEANRAFEALRISARALESTAEGVMITDEHLHIMSVNKAFSAVTGYAESEVLGRKPSVLSSGRHDTSFYRRMWRDLEDTGHWQGEIWNRRKSGEIYPEWLTISAVTGADGKVSHYVGVFRDISRSKEDEEKLDFLAHHDPLTQLPNRTLFHYKLQEALAKADEDGDVHICLMFVDLDRFKSVNDTHGHTIGDAVLRNVAQRLRGALRKSDIVARMGGDEFTILLDRLRSREEAEAIARKIVDVLHVPFSVDGKHIHCPGSIGISCYPEDAGDLDSLISHADSAMYEAKRGGRNRYFFHSGKDAQTL